MGALFVNPGGPGGSATSLARALAAALPDDVVDRFDIVGFDPRGVGGPDALACTDGVTEMYHGRPDDRGRRGPSGGSSPPAAPSSRTCTEDRLDLLAHAGTERRRPTTWTSLRRALGDEQISYLGYSYGTAIGQVYADRFPDRVRAMVLDGVVDLAEPGVAGAEGAGGRLRAGARALQRLVRGRRRLPDRAPIRSPPSSRSPRPPSARPSRRPARAAGPDRARSRSPWPRPCTARAAGPTWPRRSHDARSGDGTGLVRLADSLHRHGRLRRLLRRQLPRRTLARRRRHAGRRRAGERRPRPTSARPSSTTTSAAASGRCRPIPSRRRRLVRISPPVLVISTVGDPATPYESGVAVADHLATGVLLTYEGDGHTIAFGGSGCIDDAVVRYLVDLDPPGRRDPLPAR